MTEKINTTSGVSDSEYVSYGRELEMVTSSAQACRARMRRYRRDHLTALACEVHDFHEYAETAADQFLTRAGTGGCISSEGRLFRIVPTRPGSDGGELVLSLGHFAGPDAQRALAAAEVAYIAALEEFHARALDRMADEEVTR